MAPSARPFGALIHEDGTYFPDFCWYPMAVEAIRLANQAGFLTIAITNQSQIADVGSHSTPSGVGWGSWKRS
jgi:histidinol phosphatase-like enzyme